jgi:hypothetical protein
MMRSILPKKSLREPCPDYAPMLGDTTFWWMSSLSIGTAGTDLLIVQGMLSRKVAFFIQFSLFLLICAVLSVFYRLLLPAVTFTRTHYVFPNTQRVPCTPRGQRAGYLGNLTGCHV